MDPEQLLYRINTGQGVKASDIVEVVEALNAFCEKSSARPEVSIDEVYSLILVLGRAHVVEEKRTIEKFLDVQDPETVSLILEILCEEWGLTEEYLEHVLSFALGQSWDGEGDAQGVAIKLLGEYLHGTLPQVRKKPEAPKLKAPKQRSHAVLSLLLSLFEDEAAEDEVRQRSYYALMRSGGVSWEEIPSAYAKLSFEPGSHDIDWDLIAELHHSLSSLSAESTSGF